MMQEQGLGSVRPILVIDTNILDQDLSLTGVSWTALAEAVRSEEVDVVVPEVVVREASRHINREAKASRKEIEQAIRAIGEALKSAQLADGILPALPSVREIRELGQIDIVETRSQVVRRLVDIGCSVAPIPNVDHHMLVDWSLSSHRPFDVTDKGYRDALIWFTLCELALGEPHRFLILVTNDNDYCAKGSVELHSELAVHLQSIGRSGSIAFARSVPEALTRAQLCVSDQSWRSAPELGSAEVIRLLHPYVERKLHEVLESSLTQERYEGNQSIVIGLSFEDVVAPIVTELGFEVGGPTLVLKEYEYRGATTMGKLQVDCEIVVHAFMHKSDFERLGDRGPKGWGLQDPDCNEHYVTVYREIDVIFEFSYLLDNAGARVTALDLVEISHPRGRSGVTSGFTD